MRPEKIELQYFGPYAHELIDFNQFRSQSLFLVAGNTGAGKTTIFDAMCYALFGQTTNDRDRSAAALRSDFAPVDQETKVTFTFAHQGNTYQIMRRPKQTLQGRGGKLVDHNQAVSLIYPLDSESPHEITKIKDADNFITDLLNLTRDQFKQIVLLPQGKFRQFLDSDSNTKEALLRDLFNTSLYEKWATSLKEKLNTQKKGLVDQQTKLQSIKETITTVDAQLKTADWEEAATKLVTEYDQRLTELRTKEKDQQAKVNDLTKQLHAGQELQKNIEELTAVKKQSQSLQEQKNEIDKVSHQIANLKWYQGHQTTYQQWQDSRKRLTDLQNSIKDLTNQQGNLTVQYDTASHDVEELSKQQVAMDKLQDQVRSLQDKLPLFEQVDELTKTVSKLQNKFDQKNVQLKEKQQKASETENGLAELKANIQGQGDLAKRQVKLVERTGEYDQVLRLQKNYEENESSLHNEQKSNHSHKTTLERLQAKFLEQKEELTELNDDYARHQIAVLATKLKPGSPCPVCGSTDHPQPAHLEDKGELVTEAQVNAATDQLQATQSKLSRCQEQLKQSDKLVAKLMVQLSDTGEEIMQLLGLNNLPADWTAVVEKRGQQLAQEKDELQSKKQQLIKWQEQQESLQGQSAALAETIRQLENESQETQQELVKQQTLLAEKQSALPEQITDIKAAQQYLKGWQQEIAKFDKQVKDANENCQQLAEKLAVNKAQLRKAQGDAEKEQGYLDQQTELLTKALADFDNALDWSFWQTAADALPQLEQLQNQVQEYATKVHDCERQQLRLEKLIKDQHELDVQVLQKELQDANEHLAQLQQSLGELTSHKKQVEETIERAKAIVSQQSELDQQINQLQTLTDVVTGNTENHLSLERYVLQSYFRDVLLAANVQLARLTNGRYQFELSQESHGAGAKWSGLEVNVYDDNAGRTRSARTLSGGESFMASLALALALCQIIQEQSGGITIDALFIDEGFGSLDQQALEDALHALQELEGHRMIGIISHVTELEEQIPDQLVVESINGRSKVSYVHDF